MVEDDLSLSMGCKDSIPEDRFQQASEEDQKWVPQVYMPGQNGTRVDTVPLLEPTSTQKAEFTSLGYSRPNSHGFTQ